MGTMSINEARYRRKVLMEKIKDANIIEWERMKDQWLLKLEVYNSRIEDNWISVEDDLPKQYGMFEVHSKSRGVTILDYSSHYNGGDYFFDPEDYDPTFGHVNSSMVLDVTHFRNPSEPPK